MTQHITPHLWFNTEAKEAAEFYVWIFPNSRITDRSVITDTPSGDCDILSFELSGHPFMAISAGPLFKINPSISFFLNFDPSQDEHAVEHLDRMWAQLIEGGTALMPLQEYPFSKRYGWVQDKFGVTWQLILTDPKGAPRPFIVPSLLFVGEQYGKAEEATDFYLSVFDDTSLGTVARYPAGMESIVEGTIMFTDFQLLGQWFAAMDGPGSHAFSFNEAISLLIPCETQADIDRYWEKLSAHPEAEQCGWLKDRYGISWQVWPVRMGEMMREGSREQIERVTHTFLTMKKFDLARLEEAYRGESTRP